MLAVSLEGLNPVGGLYLRGTSIFSTLGPSINYVCTQGEGGGQASYTIAYYMQKGGRGSR